MKELLFIKQWYFIASLIFDNILTVFSWIHFFFSEKFFIFLLKYTYL